MAHRLTGDQDSGSAGSRHNDQVIAGKTSLNRRDYVRLGAATIGLSAIGGSAEASTGTTNEYQTDFREYSR